MIQLHERRSRGGWLARIVDNFSVEVRQKYWDEIKGML